MRNHTSTPDGAVTAHISLPASAPAGKEGVVRVQPVAALDQTIKVDNGQVQTAIVQPAAGPAAAAGQVPASLHAPAGTQVRHEVSPTSTAAAARPGVQQVGVVDLTQQAVLQKEREDIESRKTDFKLAMNRGWDVIKNAPLVAEEAAKMGEAVARLAQKEPHRTMELGRLVWVGIREGATMAYRERRTLSSAAGDVKHGARHVLDLEHKEPNKVARMFGAGTHAGEDYVEGVTDPNRGKIAQGYHETGESLRSAYGAAKADPGHARAGALDTVKAGVKAALIPVKHMFRHPKHTVKTGLHNYEHVGPAASLAWESPKEVKYTLDSVTEFAVDIGRALGDIVSASYHIPGGKLTFALMTLFLAVITIIALVTGLIWGVLWVKLPEWFTVVRRETKVIKHDILRKKEDYKTKYLGGAAPPALQPGTTAAAAAGQQPAVNPLAAQHVVQPGGQALVQPVAATQARTHAASPLEPQAISIQPLATTTPGVTQPAQRHVVSGAPSAQAVAKPVLGNHKKAR